MSSGGLLLDGGLTVPTERDRRIREHVTYFLGTDNLASLKGEILSDDPLSRRQSSIARGIQILDVWEALESSNGLEEGLIAADSSTEARRYRDEFKDFAKDIFKTFGSGISAGRVKKADQTAYFEDTCFSISAYATVLRNLFWRYASNYESTTLWCDALFASEICPLSREGQGFSRALPAEERAVLLLPLVQASLCGLLGVDAHAVFDRWKSSTGEAKLELTRLISVLVIMLLEEACDERGATLFLNSDPALSSFSMFAIAPSNSGADIAQETSGSHMAAEQQLPYSIVGLAEEWAHHLFQEITSVEVFRAAAAIRDLVMILNFETLVKLRIQMSSGVLQHCLRLLDVLQQCPIGSSATGRDTTSKLIAHALLASRSAPSPILEWATIPLLVAIGRLDGDDDIIKTRFMTEWIAVLLGAHLDDEPHFTITQVPASPRQQSASADGDGSHSSGDRGAQADTEADIRTPSITHLLTLLSDPWFISVLQGESFSGPSSTSSSSPSSASFPFRERIVAVISLTVDRLLVKYLTLLIAEYNRFKTSSHGRRSDRLSSAVEALVKILTLIVALVKSFAKCLTWPISSLGGESAQLAYVALMNRVTTILIPIIVPKQSTPSSSSSSSIPTPPPPSIAPQNEMPTAVPYELFLPPSACFPTMSEALAAGGERRAGRERHSARLKKATSLLEAVAVDFSDAVDLVYDWYLITGGNNNNNDVTNNQGASGSAGSPGSSLLMKDDEYMSNASAHMNTSRQAQLLLATAFILRLRPLSGCEPSNGGGANSSGAGKDGEDPVQQMKERLEKLLLVFERCMLVRSSVCAVVPRTGDSTLPGRARLGGGGDDSLLRYKSTISDAILLQVLDTLEATVFTARDAIVASTCLSFLSNLGHRLSKDPIPPSALVEERVRLCKLRMDVIVETLRLPPVPLVFHNNSSTSVDADVPEDPQQSQFAGDSRKPNRNLENDSLDFKSMFLTSSSTRRNFNTLATNPAFGSGHRPPALSPTQLFSFFAKLRWFWQWRCSSSPVYSSSDQWRQVGLFGAAGTEITAASAGAAGKSGIVVCTADVVAVIEDVLDGHTYMLSDIGSSNVSSSSSSASVVGNDGMRENNNNNQSLAEEQEKEKKELKFALQDLAGVLREPDGLIWRQLSGSADPLAIIACARTFVSSDDYTLCASVRVRVVNSAGFKIPSFSLKLILRTADDSQFPLFISPQQCPGAESLPSGAMVERLFTFEPRKLGVVSAIVRVTYPDIVFQDPAEYFVKTDFPVAYGDQNQGGILGRVTSVDVDSAPLDIGLYYQLLPYGAGALRSMREWYKREKGPEKPGPVFAAGIPIPVFSSLWDRLPHKAIVSVTVQPCDFWERETDTLSDRIARALRLFYDEFSAESPVTFVTNRRCFANLSLESRVDVEQGLGDVDAALSKRSVWNEELGMWDLAPELYFSSSTPGSNPGTMQKTRTTTTTVMAWAMNSIAGDEIALRLSTAGTTSLSASLQSQIRGRDNAESGILEVRCSSSGVRKAVLNDISALVSSLTAGIICVRADYE